jgi:hypothetical protein
MEKKAGGLAVMPKAMPKNKGPVRKYAEGGFVAPPVARLPTGAEFLRQMPQQMSQQMPQQGFGGLADQQTSDAAFQEMLRNQKPEYRGVTDNRIDSGNFGRPMPERQQSYRPGSAGGILGALTRSQGMPTRPTRDLVGTPGNPLTQEQIYNQERAIHSDPSSPFHSMYYPETPQMPTPPTREVPADFGYSPPGTPQMPTRPTREVPADFGYSPPGTPQMPTRPTPVRAPQVSMPVRAPQVSMPVRAPQVSGRGGIGAALSQSMPVRAAPMQRTQPLKAIQQARDMAEMAARLRTPSKAKPGFKNPPSMMLGSDMPRPDYNSGTSSVNPRSVMGMKTGGRAVTPKGGKGC